MQTSSLQFKKGNIHRYQNRLHGLKIMQIFLSRYQHLKLWIYNPAITCNMSILLQGLGNNTDGVNIFATMEHGHLLARKIRTRIIRNGTELEPLTVANNYDFNFQEFRKPPYVRKIMSVSIYNQYRCFLFVFTKTFNFLLFILSLQMG